jgi:tetratricopeptide (TPR) repeat protein
MTAASLSAKPLRLLERLDALIALDPDSFEADCARAERACYLARQGHCDTAASELDLLRQRYEVRPHPAISTWLSLADGLMSHFTDMGVPARDKMRRAHALSAAGRLMPLHALSAAWLAHMDDTRMDVDSMVRHLGQALHLAQPDHHAARSRANLVAAQALHMAGRLDLAMPWYQRARTHANTEGDDATISAIMFNMASIRATNLRQVALTGQGNAMEGIYALMSTEATVSFDARTGSVSAMPLLPLLRAQILALQGEPAQALAVYEAHLDSAPGMSRMHCANLADQAWCRSQVGQLDAAKADALAAEASLGSDTQLDDRAATHSRCAQVFAALGDSAQAQRHSELAAPLWNDYRAMQQHVIDALSRMGPNGPL